jgi:hypothetical protein
VEVINSRMPLIFLAAVRRRFLPQGHRPSTIIYYPPNRQNFPRKAPRGPRRRSARRWDILSSSALYDRYTHEADTRASCTLAEGVISRTTAKDKSIIRSGSGKRNPQSFRVVSMVQTSAHFARDEGQSEDNETDAQDALETTSKPIDAPMQDLTKRDENGNVVFLLPNPGLMAQRRPPQR